MLSKLCVKIQVMLLLRKIPFHYTSVRSELERMCSSSKTVHNQNTIMAIKLWAMAILFSIFFTFRVLWPLL